MMGISSQAKRQTASDGPRPYAQVWWLNPWKLTLYFIIPGYAFVVLAPILFGTGIVILKFRIFVDWAYFVLGLSFLIALALWAFLADRLAVGHPPESRVPILVRPGYLDFLAVTTICAYLIWFRIFLTDPSALVALFSGGYSTRTMARTIPGITTATQFGVAYATLYFSSVWANGVSLHPRFRAYLIVIVALTIFRVYAWAERLALIEFALPIVVIAFSYRVTPQSILGRAMVRYLPLIGILGLILLFAVTEYFRSWIVHYQYERMNFWEFALSRIFTYYYTSLNNGVGRLVMLEWPTWQFENVLNSVHRFPLLVGPIFRLLVDLRASEDFLEHYADPEFNNFSGIFSVFYDVGIPGGLIVAGLMGAALGFWYHGFTRGSGLGTLLYPVTYVSLLEIMRIFYLGEARALPVFVALLIGGTFFRQAKSKRPLKASYGEARVTRRG